MSFICTLRLTFCHNSFCTLFGRTHYTHAVNVTILTVGHCDVRPSMCVCVNECNDILRCLANLITVMAMKNCMFNFKDVCYLVWYYRCSYELCLACTTHHDVRMEGNCQQYKYPLIPLNCWIYTQWCVSLYAILFEHGFQVVNSLFLSLAHSLVLLLLFK